MTQNKYFSLMFATFLLAGCIHSYEQADPVSPVPSPVVEEGETSVEVSQDKLRDDRPLDLTSAVSNYLAGRFSEELGEDMEAAGFYAQAAVADPLNADLRKRDFEFQLAVGNVEESISLALSLEEDGLGTPLSSLALMAHFAKEGDYPTALKYMEGILKSSPEVLQLKLMQSYLELANGKDVHALVKELRDFESHPALAPHKHYHIGRLFEVSGEIDLAVLEYEIASKQDAVSVFPVLRLMDLYAFRGETDKIVALKEKFYRDNPDTVMLVQKEVLESQGTLGQKLSSSASENLADALFGLATLMSSTDAGKSGYQILTLVDILDPDYGFTNFYRGVLLEEEGRYEEAASAYATQSAGTHTYVASQIRLADNYVELKKYTNAVEVLESLMRSHPDLNLARRVLAETYYNSGDYRKTVESYNYLIDSLDGKAKSSDAWLYFARGASHERLRQYEKASEDLEQSIKLQPNNPLVLNYLGYMLVDRDRDFEHGFNLIAKALVLKPNDGSILDSMGWAWFKKGEYEKAALFLERAVEVLPSDPTIHMHLGDLYMKTGHAQTSLKHFEEALSIGLDREEEEAYVRQRMGEVLNLISERD